MTAKNNSSIHGDYLLSQLRDSVSATEAKLSDAAKKIADLESELDAEIEARKKAEHAGRLSSEQVDDLRLELEKLRAGMRERDLKVELLEAQIRVAKKENEGTWRLVEKYHAIWEREMAVNQRGTIEAQYATRRQEDD